MERRIELMRDVDGFDDGAEEVVTVEVATSITAMRKSQTKASGRLQNMSEAEQVSTSSEDGGVPLPRDATEAASTSFEDEQQPDQNGWREICMSSQLPALLL
ncbi:hypothetical protein BDR22DRAFT_890067 [Usnea florida]